MGIVWDGTSHLSSGGTEQMGRRLEALLPAELLDRFQIVVSEPADPDPARIPVLWCHNPLTDAERLGMADGGWRRYARIVFVSEWQARGYVERFGIRPDRWVVIPNFVEPFDHAGTAATPPADGLIRLIYTAAPNRGLELLLAAFQRLCHEVDDVRLEVFSSFRLYGWEGIDQHFEPLYDRLRAHPQVRYHGSVPPSVLRAELPGAQIFTYPSTCAETSCLGLIEAMSAGLVCIHPELGALGETAAGHTLIYPYPANPCRHVAVVADRLLYAVDEIRAGGEQLSRRLAAQRRFADRRYGPEAGLARWQALLTGLSAAAAGRS